MRILLLLLCLIAASATEQQNDGSVAVGNLVYAGTKSSTCFSDAFIKRVAGDTGIKLTPNFSKVHSGKMDELGKIGFAVMTGEGAFTMQADERKHLKSWLENGGFLLASAGCSSKEWTASFRNEMTQLFGDRALQSVATDHPLFQTLYDVRTISLRHNGTARFEGVILDGRLVCLFSHEGLNDTAKVKGCCCCGGNEINNAQQIVANALVYALVE